MGNDNRRTPPIGSWSHSYEEDEGGVRVYRPTHSFAFPPSRRGRDTLVFEADGKLVIHSLGADDTSHARASRWTHVGEREVGLGGMPGAPEEIVEIIESTPDVLKVRTRRGGSA
jgi:hypothetical protein